MPTHAAARWLLAALVALAIASPANAAVDTSTRYAAPASTDKPILVLIHGGGWAGNSTAQTEPLAAHLQAMGYPVVNAAYRLACYGTDGLARSCPHIDKQVLDVTRQIRWARSHHAELGTSSRRIVLVGLSAGGHLAALITARGGADAAIGFSAPIVLSAQIDYLKPNVLGAVGCLHSDCPNAWRSDSPSTYHSTRPMYLAYGQHEWLVPAALNGDVMHRADPNAEVVRLPGIGHCCAANWEYAAMPNALAYVARELS